MSSSANSWFVQTGFGATLGPMTDDDLKQMAQSGEMLASDLVRIASDNEWRAASEIPGLFSAAADSVKLVEATTSGDEVVPSIGPNGEFSFPANEASPPPPEAIRQSDSETAKSIKKSEPLGESQEDVIAQWKATRPPTIDEMGLMSLAGEIDEAPAHKTETVAAAPTAPGGETAEPAFVTAPTIPSDEPRASLKHPSFLSQIAPRPMRVESQAEKWDRLRRSLPGWSIAIAVGLILFSAWWIWPRSQYQIYRRYVAILNELNQSRDNFKDKNSFDAFVAQATTEVDGLVNWLTPRANASNQEFQLLLFVGRDGLLPILKNPREKGSPQEKKVQSWLKRLDEIYSPPANPKPRPAFIGSDSTKAQDEAHPRTTPDEKMAMPPGEIGSGSKLPKPPGTSTKPAG